MTLTDQKIKEITDYIFVKPDLRPSDVGFVFGTYRSRQMMAEHASDLFHKGYFKKIIVTGGVSDISKGRSESYWIKRILINRDVPKESIFTENKSKNGKAAGSMFGTYWNVIHALPILEMIEQEHKVESIMAVTHAFHSRRALMTLNALLPDRNTRVSSFNIFDVKIEKWYEDQRFTQFVLSEIEKIEKFFKNGKLVTEVHRNEQVTIRDKSPSR